MFRPQALTFLVALALSGAAVAQCRNNWLLPPVDTLVTDEAAEFHMTRFANFETKLLIIKDGRPLNLLFISDGRPLNLLSRRGAMLIKGYDGPDLEGLAKEAAMLQLFSAPVYLPLRSAINVGPCEASGSYEIAQELNGRDVPRNLKLLRAVGRAEADGQGSIRYSIHFETEPAGLPGQTLTYTGMMSFVMQGQTMPDETDVGDFTVLTEHLPAFVAPTGMTLAELRTRIGPAKP